MKYTTVLLTCVYLILSGCKENKKDEVSTSNKEETIHSWSEQDIAGFTANCTGFLEREGVTDAEKYCDCLLESSLDEYPEIEEATELGQAEIVALFEKSECIDELLLVKIEHPWTAEAEALFLENCQMGKVEGGLSEENAAQYCNCALAEVRKLIPNPHHVIALTEEELTHIFNKCE